MLVVVFALVFYVHIVVQQLLLNEIAQKQRFGQEIPVSKWPEVTLGVWGALLFWREEARCIVIIGKMFKPNIFDKHRWSKL